MGIIASEEKYFEAVKSLYPQGIFFEKQFEDKNSDLSKIARCQAKNIYEFKKELNNLWLDSRLETCTEDTIEDYERTLSGIFRSELTLEERKSILLIQSKNKLDIDSLNLITQKYYTANILSINEKLEPSVFGYARFGQTRIFNYRSFIVVMISLTIENPSKKNELEAFLETMFMANKVLIFNYVLPDIEEMEPDYMTEILKNYLSGAQVLRIETEFNESRFAIAKFGQTRIFNYRNKNIIIIYVVLAGKRKRALFEEIFYTVFSVKSDKTIFFVYVEPAKINLDELNEKVLRYEARIVKAFNYFDSSEFGDLTSGQTRIFNFINDKAIIFYVQLENESNKNNFEDYVRSIYPENIVFFEYIN